MSKSERRHKASTIDGEVIFLSQASLDDLVFARVARYDETAWEALNSVLAEHSIDSDKIGRVISPRLKEEIANNLVSRRMLKVAKEPDAQVDSVDQTVPERECATDIGRLV